MRKLIMTLMAGGTALAAAGCTTEPAPVRPATAAEAAAVCGDYGYVDVNNDGCISGERMEYLAHPRLQQLGHQP